MKKIFAFLFFISFSFTLAAQNYTIDSRKAIKRFEKGLEFYKTGAYRRALEKFDAAIKVEPQFVEVFLMKAQIYEDLQKYKQAVLAYNQAVAVNPDFRPATFLIKGNLELHLGKYADAKTSYQKFLTFRYKKQRYDSLVKEKIKICNFAIKAIANPVPFHVKNMGKAINSKYRDYWPSLTADNQTLTITRLIPRDSTLAISNQNAHEDFFYSHFQNGEWTEMKNMGVPINTQGNEGAQSISIDGRIMLFTACNRPGGLGSCDIYFSRQVDGEWTVPQNIGRPINSELWEAQACLSADGQSIYFVSNRAGGKGKMDIWKSEIGADGFWQQPVNLGDSINTPLDDMSPFLHPDGQSLYFSSAGFLGMGGKDLFLARRNVEGDWKTPINFGYPINTQADESSVIVNTEGSTAYIVSDRLGGEGDMDILSFDMNPELMPLPVTYAKALVFDAENKDPLKANYELIELPDSEHVVRGTSSKKTGSFLVCLQIGITYALNVSKPGYMFFSEHYYLSDKHSASKPFLLEVPLQPIVSGARTVLKNIFFETDAFQLKNSSNVELNKLLNFLKYNSKLTVEIGGHTDNVGSAEYNKKLSENRAKSVYEYLLKRGIAASRMSYKGYGAEKPIADNSTEAGRAKNRRTEFIITGVK